MRVGCERNGRCLRSYLPWELYDLRTYLVRICVFDDSLVVETMVKYSSPVVDVLARARFCA